MKSLVIVAALAAPVAAQPADVSADQAVALYRERNPRLVASRAQVDVTAADIVDAGIHPNPSIAVSSTNIVQGQDTFGHSQETLELDVPILIGRQRGHRKDAATARVATKRAEVAATQATAELDIRRKWLALLASQHKVEAFAKALDEDRAVRVLVAGRASAGAKSPYDLERMDLAVAMVASKLDDARIDDDVAANALAAAVGIRNWRPHATGELAPSAEVAAVMSAGHPELAVPQAAKTQARLEEDQAHADAVPTPSLQLQSFGTTDPQGIALMLGVSIPIPIFDRNQGAVARARASAQLAHLEHDAKSHELETELDHAAHVLAARKQGLSRFESDAIVRLDKVREMAEVSYKSGQGGIVELLDALDAISEARQRHIDLIEGVLDAELDVRAAASGR